MNSVGKEWTRLVDELVHITHPVPGRNCTLSLLNPLTGSLEWLSVDCHKQYSISTLVCKKSIKEEKNVVKLLYVDMTSYIEHHEGSFKDSRLLHSCPDQVYILFCAHGGFSMKQIMRVPHKAHEVPKNRLYRFKILKYSMSNFEYFWFDRTPVMNHLFERTCINKTYFYYSTGLRNPYKRFWDTRIMMLYGHFSLCPIKITMKPMNISKSHLSDISVTFKSMNLTFGLKSCPRSCISHGRVCICSSPDNKTSVTNIDEYKQTVSILKSNLKVHGLCISIVDTKMHHYDCRNVLKKKEGQYHAWSIIQSVSSSTASAQKVFKCSFGLFQCKDGHCISPLVINDHHSDCPDGTDEIGMCGTSNDCDVCKLPNCVCSSNLYQCAQGGCILWDRVGNGQQDCKFGEDEIVFAEINNPRYRPLPCSVYDISPCVNYTNYQPFLCDKTNISIPGEWVNDLIPDCPMSDDEPPQTEYIVNDCYPLLQCTPGHPRCFPVYGLCVYNHDKHGHLSNCRNGAHLGNCQPFSCSGYFKCPSSYCLPVWKICDNVTDCRDGEDEEGCVAEQELSCPGFLRCKGGGCVHPLQVCDGQVDCYISQEDEYGCDKALCPESCDCLGATITCHTDVALDVRNYKALFRMDNIAETVDISNGRSLYMLNISRNRVGIINTTTFQGLSSLVFLDISSNRIDRIATHSFMSQRHLILLNINDNQIKVVETMAFAGLESMLALDLSDQHITKLDAILVNISSTLKMLNVSSNSIERLNLHTIGDLSNVVTLDIRYNPITRVNVTGANNLTNLTILTDISYLCCFNEIHTCNKTNYLGICPHSKGMAADGYLGICTIILNIIHYARKRRYCKARSSSVLFSVQVLFNSLMGISVLMPLLKDIIFLPEIVHHQQGGKYMYCLGSGTFQLFLVLFVSCLAIFKSVNTFYGTRSIIKETSNQRYQKYICLAVIFLVNVLMSLIPSLVSFVNRGLLPNASRLCTLFNALNIDHLGTVVSIGDILCLIIINSIVHIIVSLLTLKTIHDSQRAVKRMGGRVSSGKDTSVLFFTCLIQPVAFALMQITASIVCFLPFTRLVSEQWEYVSQIFILLPGIIQSILGNIK